MRRGEWHRAKGSRYLFDTWGYADASIVTLFALHNADIIHLLRPYAVERSAHGGFSDPPWNGIVFEDALDTCLAAATQIIEQVHYIRDKHGMVTAPCNIQE